MLPTLPRHLASGSACSTKARTGWILSAASSRWPARTGSPIRVRDPYGHWSDTEGPDQRCGIDRHWTDVPMGRLQKLQTQPLAGQGIEVENQLPPMPKANEKYGSLWGCSSTLGAIEMGAKRPTKPARASAVCQGCAVKSTSSGRVYSAARPLAWSEAVGRGRWNGQRSPRIPQRLRSASRKR